MQGAGWVSRMTRTLGCSCQVVTPVIWPVSIHACIDAESLSQALTELLFTEEMAFGCATKLRRLGINKLDPKRLHAIRG